MQIAFRSLILCRVWLKLESRTVKTSSILINIRIMTGRGIRVGWNVDKKLILRYLNDWWELINKVLSPVFHQKYIKFKKICIISWVLLFLSLRMSLTREICATLMFVNFTALLANFPFPIRRRQIVGDRQTQRRTQEEHKGSQNNKTTKHSGTKLKDHDHRRQQKHSNLK